MCVTRGIGRKLMGLQACSSGRLQPRSGCVAARQLLQTGNPATAAAACCTCHALSQLLSPSPSCLLTLCFCLPLCLPGCPPPPPHTQAHLYNLFLNVVSGIRIPPGETSTDLAVLAAVASSVANAPLPPGTALLGEVGLRGELQQVANLEVREGRGHLCNFHRLAPQPPVPHCTF